MKIDRNKIELAMANAENLCYADVAHRMGCSKQNLSVILNRGSCTPANAGKLARALGVAVAEIMEEAKQQ